MSTKSTLVYGTKYHLYTEGFDFRDNVWLELDKCVFEATDRGIKVEIPIAIWEVIRQITPVRFDLADLTNVQVKEMGEKQVMEQRAKYLKASKSGNKKLTAWLQLSYGDAKLPQEEHLANVLKELRTERAAQRKLRREIQQLSPKPKPSTKTAPLSTEAKA